MRTEQDGTMPDTAVLYRYTTVPDDMGGLTETWAAVGTVTVAALVGLVPADVPVLTWNDTPGIPEFYILQTLRSLIAVCFSLCMLFVGMRFLNFTSLLLVYAQEAVLPFFMLHQPAIVFVAFFVDQWEAALLPKLSSS